MMWDKCHIPIIRVDGVLVVNTLYSLLSNICHITGRANHYIKNVP